MILPYNRVVKDLNGLSREQFFEAVKEKFELEEIGKEPYAPAEKGTFGMYLDNTWYALKVLPQYKSADPVKGLDVSILQDQLLGPVLGIGDPERQAYRLYRRHPRFKRAGTPCKRRYGDCLFHVSNFH